MTPDKTSSWLRHALRAGVVASGLTLGSLAAPAMASAPTTWENADNPPAIQTLLYLLGVPILLFIVIWILVYLPSMMRRESSTPAVAFQNRSEWFGAPRSELQGTTEATDEPSAGSSEKGGAGASW